MKGIVVRIATGIAVGAVLMTLVALPASAAVTPIAAPVVNVANPSPGDYLRRGQNWVAGIACDPNASLAGTTPEFSVNAAENSRLGLASPDVSSCKQPFSAWRVLPSSFKKGIYEMNVYVQAKNGKETKVTISGLRVDNP